MSAFPRTPLAVLAAAGALVALSACGGTGSGSAGGGPITVEASDTSCRVSATTAAAGNVTFEVTNKGSKVTEFYLYAEGDRIMGEVENIAPGLNRRLIVEVPEAGTYQTACKPGMTGDGIRGTFTVTGGAQQQGDVNAQKAAATKTYAAYVTDNSRALAAETAKFADAVKSGNVAQAKSEYARTRVFYERIEPVAEKFGDLDPAIDNREADLEPGERFTGFHRLEKDLWVTGLQPDSAQIADQLVTDVNNLVAKAGTLQLTALDLANGAKGLLDEVATGKITGEEETFSHTDLWDFQSNLDGSKAAIAALRPVIQQRDAALVSTLDTEFANVQSLLDKTRVGDGFKYYDQLSQDEVRTFASAVDALSEPLSKVAEVVAQ
ncbi:iron uptake system component EfeO [Amycolatopsis bartoniae]|uniref:Lipoprotein n=1 Tax=Amycolatopsis bartoniae TaxID=941986 RepID=A0A8H9M4R8_9PSEU|nr:iron uptake system protein EfeO [Amycolatopsis bartoniae]MBB2936833.1 iron uptake system component EfeO [Amycolatopsis bartoniae]TVT07216.1 peptidase M75 family protein [Amycolatopsis bartoniae]GHF50472.1 lipoprotein [Amycolatopsis bartoniae]